VREGDRSMVQRAWSCLRMAERVCA